MKQTKIVLTVAGILGLLSMFVLPYISAERGSFKFWDFKKLLGSGGGLINNANQVYIALIGFLLVLGAGAFGLAKKKLPRGIAILGAIGGLIALAPKYVHEGMSKVEGQSTAFGAKLLFLSAIVAIIAGVVGAAKPDNG